MKVLRNFLISLIALLMVFYIGGAVMVILMSIGLSYSIAKLVDYLLPIKENN